MGKERRGRKNNDGRLWRRERRMTKSTTRKGEGQARERKMQNKPGLNKK